MKRKKLPLVLLAILAVSLPLLLIGIKQVLNTRSSAAAADKLEAEGGTLSSGASKQTDTTASGGQYVLFQNQTNSPTPTSPPSASEIYGPGVSADALNNTRIGTAQGYKDDYRFRADHSGTLKSFRVYVIWSYSKDGYHEGDGGTLKFELRTDDGTSSHKPSNSILATVIHDDPLNKGSFPLINFANSPTLQKDQIYHIVVTNIHPDPVNNYVSMDHTFVYNPTNPMQPKFNDLDWAEMQASNTQDWYVRRNNTPILALYYGDGHTQGYGYMETWVGADRPASGNQKFRERFTVSGGTRSISELNIRLRRDSGNDPLTYVLKTQSGTVIQQGTIPAANITTATNPEWTKTTFSSKQLVNGQSYFLEFSAPGTSVYEAYPVRYGNSYNFPASTYFADGYAEYTSDGSTWYGWMQWGVNDRKEQNLQFYFK